MNTVQDLSENPLVAFDRLRESIFADLNVAKLGVVTGFSSDTGLPTVRPLTKQRVIDSRGNCSWIDYPEIPDVLYVGEKPAQDAAVLLIFCDHDISPFLTLTGTDTAGAVNTQMPQLIQSHGLSNAVAFTLASSSGGPGVTASSTAYAPPTYAPIVASTSPTGSGMSEAGIEFIKSWEGFAADWTKDTAGNWMIGYGHVSNAKTLPAGYTAPLTATTAATLLAADLPTYIGIVNAAFPGRTFATNQLDALASFLYCGQHMGVTAAQIIAKAQSYVGVTETPINNVVFNTDYYGHIVNGYDYPWCVVFVWDMFRMLGASDLFYGSGKTASSTALMNYGQSAGLRVEKNNLQAGDIVFYSWGGSTTVADHTEIVVSVNGDGTISAVGGNTGANSDRVDIRTRSLTDVICGYRPQYGPIGTAVTAWISLKNAVSSGASSEDIKRAFDIYTFSGGVSNQRFLYRRDAEWAMYNNGNYLKP